MSLRLLFDCPSTNGGSVEVTSYNKKMSSFPSQNICHAFVMLHWCILLRFLLNSFFLNIFFLYCLALPLVGVSRGV